MCIRDSTWTKYSSTIGGGVSTDGDYSATLFRPGTHSIRPIVLSNYTPKDDPQDTDSILQVSNFELNETAGVYANGVATYTERSAPISLVDSDAMITDVDDAYTESVQVTLTNGKIGDWLTADTATLSGYGISVTGVTGSALTADGSVVVTLSADAPETVTRQDFAEALQYLYFENTSEDPNTEDRIVEFVVNDGELDSATNSLPIKNIATPESPDIIDLDAYSLAYTEGDGAVGIEQSADALVTDVDSANFDGGNLHVSFFSGSTVGEDVLTILDIGTGAGQIGYSAGTVTYAGTAIGTATGGRGGTPLQITFNSNATQAAVSELIRAISSENTNTGNTSMSSRSAQFASTDHEGAT